MSFDPHTNFAYATVAIAPSPASSGTSLTVAAGLGALFAAVPANATVWPVALNALSTNAEIVRVTARVGDVLTIVRAQESTSARTILAGDQLAITITAKKLTDIESVDAYGNIRWTTSAAVLAYGQFARVTTDLVGANTNLTFVSRIVGDLAPVITYVDPMGNDASLSLSIEYTDSTKTIDVNLATGPGGAITTIANDIIAAFATADGGGQEAVHIAVSLAPGSDGTGVVAVGDWTLAGGANGVAVKGPAIETLTISGPGSGSYAGHVALLHVVRTTGSGYPVWVGFDAGLGLYQDGTDFAWVVGNGAGSAEVRVSMTATTAGLQAAGGELIVDGDNVDANVPINAPNFIGPVMFPTSDPGIPGAWWNNAGTLVESV